jgi:hypothetical protein
MTGCSEVREGLRAAISAVTDDSWADGRCTLGEATATAAAVSAAEK